MFFRVFFLILFSSFGASVAMEGLLLQKKPLTADQLNALKAKNDKFNQNIINASKNIDGFAQDLANGAATLLMPMNPVVAFFVQNNPHLFLGFLSMSATLGAAAMGGLVYQAFKFHGWIQKMNASHEIKLLMDQWGHAKDKKGILEAAKKLRDQHASGRLFGRKDKLEAYDELIKFFEGYENLDKSSKESLVEFLKKTSGDRKKTFADMSKTLQVYMRGNNLVSRVDESKGGILSRLFLGWVISGNKNILTETAHRKTQPNKRKKESSASTMSREEKRKEEKDRQNEIVNVVEKSVGGSTTYRHLDRKRGSAQKEEEIPIPAPGIPQEDDKGKVKEGNSDHPPLTSYDNNSKSGAEEKSSSQKSEGNSSGIQDEKGIVVVGTGLPNNGKTQSRNKGKTPTKIKTPNKNKIGGGGRSGGVIRVASKVFW